MTTKSKSKTVTVPKRGIGGSVFTHSIERAAGILQLAFPQLNDGETVMTQASESKLIYSLRRSDVYNPEDRTTEKTYYLCAYVVDKAGKLTLLRYECEYGCDEDYLTHCLLSGCLDIAFMALQDPEGKALIEGGEDDLPEAAETNQRLKEQRKEKAMV